MTSAITKYKNIDSTVLVIGRYGQLAQSLIMVSADFNIKIISLSSTDMDISDREAVKKKLLYLFQQEQIDAVINAAAYTNVDLAETEKNKAFAVNAQGPEYIAGCCAGAGVPLVHISTDYVFDGQKNAPYNENDTVNPINVYGRSKLEGENAVRSTLSAHIILRTSWVYSPFGKNFVKTMIRLRDKKILNIVNDQTGTPSYAPSIAEAVLNIVLQIKSKEHHDLVWGTYNYSGAGAVSWYNFARSIFGILEGYNVDVPDNISPILSKDYPTPANRPFNSVLDCRKINQVFGIESQKWQVSLKKCIDTLYDIKEESALNKASAL